MTDTHGERRRFTRARIDLPVEVQQGGSVWKQRLIDLSLVGGLLVMVMLSGYENFVSNQVICSIVIGGGCGFNGFHGNWVSGRKVCLV